MQLIVNLLLIQVIVCYVIDLSGFIQEMEYKLSKWLKIKAKIPKPFSCSLCSGLWLNILYLLILGKLTLITLTATALISFFSKNISGFLRWIQEFLIWIEGYLYRLIR